MLMIRSAIDLTSPRHCLLRAGVARSSETIRGPLGLGGIVPDWRVGVHWSNENFDL